MLLRLLRPFASTAARLGCAGFGLALLAMAPGCRNSSEPPPGMEGSGYHPPVTPTVTIENNCANAVPVFFGNEPNGDTARHFVLRAGSTSHIQRDENGELVVWVTDDRGFGVMHVRVSKRMSRVEIGTSCKNIHAS